MLLDLFKKTRYSSMKIKVNEAAKSEDAVVTCPSCGRMLDQKDYQRAFKICPYCKSYGRLSARRRIDQIADKNTFVETFSDLVGKNPLQFEGYEERLIALREKTALTEAVLTGTCKIGGNEACIAVMDTHFLMASMGTAVGEKLTRLFELGIEKALPVVIFTASGGARMHEGIFSLMQMAKVSLGVLKHSKAGLFYLTVLTDPTTGGVSASFASLGDIILAEQGATYGFAGRRVIEDTVGEKLADDFQSAERAMENGFVDRVVARDDLKETIVTLLSLHKEA